MRLAPARKVLWVVDLVLVALLVVTGLGLFSKGAQSNTTGLLTGRAGSAQGAARRSTLTNEEADVILKSGAIVPPPATAASPTPVRRFDEAPKPVEQGFNFELIGTAIDASTSRAFLRDTSAGTQVCKGVGDDLGDAKIAEIYEDHIIIDRGGRKGVLWMAKPATLGEGEPSVSVAATPAIPIAASPRTFAGAAGGAAPPKTPEQIAAEADNGEEGGDNGDDEDSDQMVMSVKSFKDYLQNIGFYLNQISTRSHTTDNKIDGIELVKVPQDSEAYKRGFREGDVVKSIQGQDVTDATAAINLGYEILKNEDYVVDVIVTRNGQEEILTFEIWPD